MTSIIGIDLGTTNSGVAVVQNRQPHMLANGKQRIIPSVVGYANNGQWLVGTPAWNQYVYDPENTVVSIKRKMGSETRVKLGPHELTPPEISAFILRELKTTAERVLGHPVTDAVITVPAYFSDAQRQATRDAGRIAGLTVRRILNEPTAAALAYGLNLETDRLVLVYDLGGGTFDVSLVELMDGIVEVRASHGNTQLGGDDFDDRLAVYVAEQFASEHGIDLQTDPRAWARLRRAAERAKIQLSDHPFVWLKEEYIAEKGGVPLHLAYEVSRQGFESLIEDLLAQTIHSIEQVLQDAEVSAEEIDQVLLVGGSTRIPAVWELVREAIGVEPQMTINPEEAVALGAGVQAAIIAGQPIDAILVDVTAYSLGIAIAEFWMGQVIPNRYKVLIHRNTTIPVTKEELFHTIYPGQDTVKVEVYQGDEEVASENTLLGEFLITGLQSVDPGEPAEVTVRFDFDLDGILHVTARDRFTGKEEMITVATSLTRLGEAQIVAAQTRLAETAVLLPDTAKALLERAHRLLAQPDVSAEAHTRLDELLADIKAAQSLGQHQRLDELLETLLDILFDYE